MHIRYITTLILLYTPLNYAEPLQSIETTPLTIPSTQSKQFIHEKPKPTSLRLIRKQAKIALGVLAAGAVATTVIVHQRKPIKKKATEQIYKKYVRKQMLKLSNKFQQRETKRNPFLLPSAARQTYLYFDKINPQTPIKNLRLLGAHNAGATAGYRFAAQCQTLRIEDLLNMGVSVLDLRISWVEGAGFAIYHNILPMPATLFEVLTAVESWLAEHDKQFVTIILKDEETHERSNREVVAKKLDDFLNVNPNLKGLLIKADFNVPLIKVQSKVQLIIRDFYGYSGNEDYSLNYDDIKWQDWYGDDIKLKKSHILRGFDSALSDTESRIYYGHYISFRALPLLESANEMNKWVLQQSKQLEGDHSLGMFLLDFIPETWAVHVRDWNMAHRGMLDTGVSSIDN